MKPTYVLDPAAPPPIGWDVYAEHANAEWQSLLRSAPPEAAFQYFLERHPGFLPGADGLRLANRNSYDDVVFTQPALPGIQTRIPDFLFFLTNSADFVPVFIELEHPSKKWFTSKRIPTSDLIQALGQVAEWKAWLESPANRDNFFDLYVWSTQLKQRSFKPCFLLIYGSGEEFEGKPDLSKLRGQWESSDTSLMTFKRLRLSQTFSRSLTVRYRAARLSLVSVPPTFKIGAFSAETFLRIDELGEVFEQMELVTAERRAFLRGRVEYWRAWARRIREGEMFMVAGPDSE